MIAEIYCRFDQLILIINFRIEITSSYHVFEANLYFEGTKTEALTSYKRAT